MCWIQKQGTKVASYYVRLIRGYKSENSFYVRRCYNPSGSWGKIWCEQRRDRRDSWRVWLRKERYVSLYYAATSRYFRRNSRWRSIVKQKKLSRIFGA